MFLLLFLIHSVQAAETEYKLEPIVVKASSSFDSLSAEEYLPQKKISFEFNRSGTLETLEKSEPFPSVNYGYPSGAMGTTLGGRSIDDTQVSTLGVPLNLPQGGGPDLSFFPSFLWSGVTLSTVPSTAGFSPQGISGSMQLELWTRTQVRDHKFSSTFSRVTGNYDRNLQNFSVGTKKENIAILGGMNFGREQGPAGSLSYYFIRKPKSHFIFHLLGSDQEGDNPGDKKFPTPLARKKTWRVIPALESHQEFGDDEEKLIFESTFYADLNQMVFETPGVSRTSDRSQEYGIENAIHWKANTLALTGRLVSYQSSTFGSFQEWPILAQLSHDFQFNEEWKMRLSGGGNFVSDVGFYPTGRASFKYQIDHDSNYFFELNSLAKMPTLTSRHYLYGTYHGNPNLNPERVNAAIAGFDIAKNKIESTTTLKNEYRNQIQVNQNNTTENAGNAYLISLLEDIKWKATQKYTTNVGTLFTYSKLADSGFSYPDLPFVSFLWGSTYTFSDQIKLNHDFHFMGHSTAAGGGMHDAYFLMNFSVDYLPTEGTIFTLGCDNVTDKRAEVVVDYPLPGRIVYLNLSTRF